MGQDNWGDPHTFACATCQWFVSKGGGAIGRCRRHAPTTSGYPAVFVNDWCGDHKIGGATPRPDAPTRKEKR